MSHKPSFNLVRTNNSQMKGGFNYGRTFEFEPVGQPSGVTSNPKPNPADPVPAPEEDLYLYKAKKYHYKCQQKIRTMMAQGKPCPAGYERYLQPFSA